MRSRAVLLDALFTLLDAFAIYPCIARVGLFNGMAKDSLAVLLLLLVMHLAFVSFLEVTEELLIYTEHV